MGSGWYCRYGVSYRDLEEMMTERGVPVDHTTIYRWVQKYAPELDKQTRWYRRVPDWQASFWRADETYIRVGGRWPQRSVFWLRPSDPMRQPGIPE